MAEKIAPPRPLPYEGYVGPLDPYGQPEGVSVSQAQAHKDFMRCNVVEDRPDGGRKKYRGDGGIKLPGDGRAIEVGEEVILWDGRRGVVVEREVGAWVLRYKVALMSGQDFLRSDIDPKYVPKVIVKNDQLEPVLNP